MRILGLILMTLTLVSCSSFHSSRSFLSEMDHDNSTLFSPDDDFPVVVGDSGQNWTSDEDRRERTPLSEEDRYHERAKLSLQEELRSLENRQSENALLLYEKYRHRLGTTSERIYFLGLPHSERRSYLSARGFIDEPKRRVASLSHRLERNTYISLGMSKGEVLGSLGKPARVEVAGNPHYENERWAYSQNGATKYIYFESGRVGGWE